MAEDTLLDTFVVIDVRGQAGAMATINNFTSQVKRAFGDVATSQGFSAREGADNSIQQTKRGVDGAVKSYDKLGDAASKLAARQAAAAKDAADAIIAEANRASKSVNEAMDSMNAFLNRQQPPPAGPALAGGTPLSAFSGDELLAHLERLAAARKKFGVEEITSINLVGAARADAAEEATNLSVKSDAQIWASRTRLIQRQKVAAADLQRSQLAAGRQGNQIAIQLGQAFEDAAIGFSLNGVQGAIRGAANNVNFLIAQLSLSGQLAAVFGTTIAGAAPLLFAVGTAAAFVLPAIKNLVSGAEDLKENLTDIAELLKREFESKDFGIKISFDIGDQLRSIREAKDSVAVLTEKLRDSGDATRTLRDQLAGLGDNKGLALLNSGLADINIKFKALSIIQDEATRDRFVDQTRDLQKLEEALNIPQFDRIVPGADDESLRFQAIVIALDVFRKAQAKVIAQAKAAGPNGLLGDPIDEANIANASNALIVLTDNLELVKATATAAGGFMDEDLENLAKGVEAAKEQFDKLNKAAQEATLIRERLLTEGLSDALRKEHDLTSELEFQQALSRGLVTDADKLLQTMLEQEKALAKQNEELIAAADNSPAARGLADANTTILQLEHQADLMNEIRELQEKITEDRKKSTEREQEAAEKRLKQDKAVAEFILSNTEKTEKAKQVLQEETQRQANKAAEEAIADQIAALDKINAVKSQRSALGDIGQTVFGGTTTDNTKELAELKSQLEAARDKTQQEQDAARIADLEKAVRDSEEDRLKGLLKLSDENQKTERELTTAQTEAKEATDKLTDQLKTFQTQLELNRRGQGTTIPGVTDNNALNVLSTIIRPGQPGFGQAPPTPRVAPPPPLSQEEQILQAVTQEHIRQMQDAVRLGDERRAAEERRIRADLQNDPTDTFRGFEGLIPRGGQPDMPFMPEAPLIAPGAQGLGQNWQASIGNAQAEANARALENTNFRSLSLEKLLQDTNKILERVLSGVTTIDTQARFN